jgi:hypothetical protein
MEMNNQRKWIDRQRSKGWLFLVGGVILAGVGILLGGQSANLAFNPRVVTGLGILLLGVAVSYLVRYAAARRSPQTAERLLSEERDERNQFLRTRAGNRAYWSSAVLTYILLMWISLAANGGLPALSADALWYVVVALVILPFGVYAASLYYDQKHY